MCVSEIEKENVILSLPNFTVENCYTNHILSNQHSENTTSFNTHICTIRYLITSILNTDT